MALKTVTGKLTGPNNVAIGGALVTAQLSASAVIAATQEVAPLAVTTSTASDGTWSLSLQANADLIPASTYYTFSVGPNWTATAIVPQTAGPFKIEDIMAVAPNAWLGGTAATLNPAGDLAVRSVTVLANSPYVSTAAPGTINNEYAVPAPTGVAATDTANIAAGLTAMAAGGTVHLQPGIYFINATLAMSHDRTRLLGDGSQTNLRVAGAMANGLIQVTANQCTIESLLISGGAAAPASANPAADAIQIASGAVGTRILNVAQFYINGWSLNFLSTCIGYSVMVDNCQFRQCANGMTFDGTSATGFSPSVMVANTFVDTVATGDCLYLHNCHDFNAASMLLSSASTTGHGIHMKGTCRAVQIDSSDVFLPSTNAGQYALLIEVDGGNTPAMITVNATILAGGDYCVASSSGQGVAFNGCLFTLARQGSILISGGVAADAYNVVGCTSFANNVGNIGAFEVSVQSVNPQMRIDMHNFLPGTNAMAGDITAVAGVQVRNWSPIYNGTTPSKNFFRPGNITATGVNPTFVTDGVDANVTGFFIAKGSGAWAFANALANYITANPSAGNPYLQASAGSLGLSAPGQTIQLLDSAAYSKDRRISKQSPAFAASPAPDPTAGEIYAMAALTGNVTVANPVSAAQGQRILFIWTQDGTGTRTVTYSGTNWRSVGIAAQSTAASTVTIDEAVCVDGTIWRVNRLVTGQTI